MQAVSEFDLRRVRGFRFGVKRSRQEFQLRPAGFCPASCLHFWRFRRWSQGLARRPDPASRRL